MYVNLLPLVSSFVSVIIKFSLEIRRYGFIYTVGVHQCFTKEDLIVKHWEQGLYQYKLKDGDVIICTRIKNHQLSILLAWLLKVVKYIVGYNFAIYCYIIIKHTDV